MRCINLKAMALDYGLVRTGIAITDLGGCMAFPLCTIYCPPNSSKADFFINLIQCIEKEAPAYIVVGLPLLKDDSSSLITRQVKNFVQRLKRRVELEIFYMPEFLSSFEAQSDLIHSKMKAKKKKAILDQQAAVRILQSFLSEPEHRRQKA